VRDEAPLVVEGDEVAAVDAQVDRFPQTGTLNGCDESATRTAPPPAGASVWKWTSVSGGGPPAAGTAQPLSRSASACPSAGIDASLPASAVFHTAVSAP
jgi:hypothetical protein